MQSADEILIVLSLQAFKLKASLRAAYLLNLKYKGFGNLANAIAAGSFTAYQDCITAGATDVAALNAFLKPFHDPKASMTPLGDAILGNRDELLQFVVLLSGANDQGDKQTKTSGKPMSFQEYHETLFRLATGWLSWSPSDAWEASPTEILNAVKGRRELLAAIFGNGEKQDDSTTAEGITPDLRSQLNALGNLQIQDMAEVR